MASTMADRLNLQPNNTQSCSSLMQRDFISKPRSSAYVYKGSYCKRMTLKNQLTVIQSNNNRSLNFIKDVTFWSCSLLFFASFPVLFSISLAACWYAGFRHSVHSSIGKVCLYYFYSVGLPCNFDKHRQHYFHVMTDIKIIYYN